MYSLHDNNISEMIGGQGHVMRRGKCQIFLKMLDNKTNLKCFKVQTIVLH